MSPEDMLPKTDAIYGYKLPDAVTESAHWYGSESDLRYIIRIPARGVMIAAIKANTPVMSVVKASIVSVGMASEMWSRSGRTTMDAGAVDDWWDRISPKAQNMICNEFMLSYCPSDDETRDHRRTRRKL